MKCYTITAINYMIHTFCQLAKDSGKIGSEVFERNESFVLHIFEKGRCKTCHFLELVREVRHAAVMKFIGDFSQRKFIVNKQLLCPFNLMGNDEVLNGSAFHFRKKCGEVIILVV